MNAKFDSRCTECSAPITEGDRFFYDENIRKSYCEECGADIQPDPQKEESVEELSKKARSNVRRK